MEREREREQYRENREEESKGAGDVGLASGLSGYCGDLTV